VNSYAAVFKKDGTFALVQRLRHNVIKTGLKNINSAYSKISFKDIKTKLNLESEQDAEFIVSKVCQKCMFFEYLFELTVAQFQAIVDGIIDGTIDQSGHFFQSSANVDVYVTNEPERAFHKRIDFLLKIHNDAVTSMRYPDKKGALKKGDEEKKDNDEDIEDEIAELLDAEDDD